MVSRMDVGPDSDLIASIAPDVMTCLRRSHFFERLDDLLCPKGDSGQRQVCEGNCKISKRILEAAGFDSDDLRDMFVSSERKELARLRSPLQRGRIESVEI